MCGIAGVTVADRPAVQGMIQALGHRGPDNSDTYIDDQVALGHARLSILDLSEAANQPMVDPATGVVLVYNGEIYNFPKLRQDLMRDGVRFESTGDTEVVLKGFIKEGARFFDRLNGIYALALWDSGSRELVLARDPLGVKPLYLLATARGIAFASESKALLPLIEPGVELDPVALAAFLRFHYTPGLQTLVRGVTRLPPGESWSYQTNGTVNWRRRTTFRGAAHSAPTADHRGLRATLEAAVDRQMISDVPVGAFLSGGIDSSLVAALAARHAQTDFHTYSVGFDAGEHDERPEARALADHLGTSHRELTVCGDDVARDLPRMTWHFDGPLGEAGCIPNYYVAGLASKEVKVVLAGEGGDELFGGYPWYRRSLRANRIGQYVRMGRPLRSVAKRLPGRIGRYSNYLLAASDHDRYELNFEVFSNEDLAASGLGRASLPRREGPFDPLAMDQETLLRDALLVKADKMTMAHGVEERVPLLDLEVLAFSRRVALPAKLGPPEKKILRDAAAAFLPDKVVGRAKRGYGTPMHLWAQGALRSLIDDRVHAPKSVDHGLFDEGLWETLVARSQRVSNRSAGRRWQLAALDVWLDEIVKRRLAHPTTFLTGQAAA